MYSDDKIFYFINNVYIYYPLHLSHFVQLPRTIVYYCLFYYLRIYMYLHTRTCIKLHDIRKLLININYVIYFY